MKKQGVSLLVYLIFFIAMAYKAHTQTVKEQAPVLRPNIVWIVCEDMSPHLSSFGDTAIQTPNLDKLAADGIRYTNAYTVAGVCAPSRNSIITGMYPQSIGGNNMRNYLANPNSKDLESIPLPPYSIVPPSYVKGFSEYLRKEGYYCTNNSKQDYQFEAPATMWDESSPKAHWRNRKDNVPFFSIFNIGVTHESQIWERANKPLKVDPSKVKVPPYYPDTRIVRRDIAIALSNVVIMDSIAGTLIQQLKEDGLYENTIIFFYSDHGDGLPFVKREVFTRGLHIPLIIKLLGQQLKNTKNDALVSAIDFPATVLSLADVVVPQYMNGRPFLGGQKAIQPRKYVFAAKDRMDTVVDRVRTVFDGRYQYIRNYMPNQTYYQNIPYRMNMPSAVEIMQLYKSGNLKGSEKKWFEVKPTEELYDIQTDPFQLNNLFGKKEYTSIQVRLKKEYDSWMESIPDLHTEPEKTMLKKMWEEEERQPETAMPKLLYINGKWFLSCATKGASMGVSVLSSNPLFNTVNRVYGYEGLSLMPGDTLRVTAQRIGYKAVDFQTIIKK